MNHDNCVQSYSREHDFHTMEQAQTYICVYCGQIRTIDAAGKVRIVRAGQKQDYYANTNPGPDYSKPSTTAAQ